MSNLHTRTTCSVYLVLSTVLVLDRQLVQLPCDVMCSTSICVPVCVDVVGESDSMSLLLFELIFLVPVPTLTGTPAVVLEADLALRIIVRWLTLLLMLL